MSIRFGKKTSHIFKHLNASKGCRDGCDNSCLKIRDHASTYYIEQLKPKPFNNQVEHVSLSLQFNFCYFLFVCFFQFIGQFKGTLSRWQNSK